MSGILDLLPDLRKSGRRHGAEFAGPCPWCAGTDRFRLWPGHPSGRARWWCRGCGRSGDGLALYREVRGLSITEAAQAAGQPVGDAIRILMAEGLGYVEACAAVGLPATVRPTTAQAPRRPAEPPLRPPSSAWQSRAEAVAVEAQAALWAPSGARALAYLHRRGFADETICGARLGYVAKDLRETPEAWGLPTDHRPVWVPRGIAIPWRACGSTWRLNVRRPAGEPKYIGPAGSGNGLFGADGLRSGLPAVVVEGEFDALAVAQAAGDLVAAVATGSTHGARHPRWVRLLQRAPVVLVAFDADDAGEQAAAWWLHALPGSRRLVPEGDDPAAMLQAGGDVRAWVAGAPL